MASGIKARPLAQAYRADGPFAERAKKAMAHDWSRYLIK